MNVHLLAADIASRIREMQADSVTNNAEIIERLIKQAKDHDFEQLKAWPLSPERQRGALLNAHRLLRRQYRAVPLWSFIRDITGHGSGYSIAVCKANGWNPDQDGVKPL